MAKGDQIKILLGYLEQKDYPKALPYVKKHPETFQETLKAMTKTLIPYWGNFAVSLSKDDFQTAEPIYRRIIEIYPQDALAHYNLGSLLHNQGKLDEAEQEWCAAIKADPNHSAAHNNLGILLSDKDDIEGAEKHYRKAIKINPNYSDTHNNLGILLYNKGNLKEAEKHYRAAIKADPKNAAAHYNLGVLLDDKGDLDGAEEHYRKAIELNPKDAVAHYNLGILLKDKGDLKEAEKEWRIVIELDPELSQAHNNLGILLRKKDKLKEAEKEYRKAIKINPNYSVAHYNLGNLLKDKGDLKEAEKEWRIAIKLVPKNAAAHYNLGNLLKDKGDLKSAEKEWRIAIELDPKDSGAHNNLSILLKKKGDLEGTEKELNKALEFAESLILDDQKKVATNLAALLRDMGYLACQLGDYEDTRKKTECLLELLEKYPVRPKEQNKLYSNAYFLLGIVDMQGEESKKAIERFRKAARLAPKDARIYHNLAVAYCYVKKFKQASQSIQAAIDIKKETGEEDERAKKLLEKIGKRLNPIRIRWWRYIPFSLTLIFWLVFTLKGECLFPQSKDGILWLMIIITFLASTVFMLTPVLPYVKKIGIAKLGDIEINAEPPEKWDYSSLTEMRQTIPAKPSDSPQASKPTRSE